MKVRLISVCLGIIFGLCCLERTPAQEGTKLNENEAMNDIADILYGVEGKVIENPYRKGWDKLEVRNKIIRALKDVYGVEGAEDMTGMQNPVLITRLFVDIWGSKEGKEKLAKLRR